MGKLTKQKPYYGTMINLPNAWDDDDWLDSLIKQQNQTSTTTIKKPIKEKTSDDIRKDLNKAVNTAKNKYDKLKEQKDFVDNECHFIFPLNQSLDEYQEWCFENDFIFVVKRCKIQNQTVQALVFKNVEDAMAFKLRWL